MNMSVTPKEAHLMNAVFLAAIEETSTSDEPISPTQMFNRVYPLVRRGERDFEKLKAAALGVSSDNEPGR
jgi:hypothetical protein